jgi:hypothetical protein
LQFRAADRDFAAVRIEVPALKTTRLARPQWDVVHEHHQGAISQRDDPVLLHAPVEEFFRLSLSAARRPSRRASEKPTDFRATEDRDRLEIPDAHRRKILRRIDGNVPAAHQPSKELPRRRLPSRQARALREPLEKESIAVAFDHRLVYGSEIPNLHPAD